ncbi:hypothetical protein ACHQM5_021668 [Ranunculus cassubicifolius]
MPPKSKAEVAKKAKVLEDKTFGLKNKNKSKNVQKYVQSLQASAQPKPDPTKIAAKKKKDEAAARENELQDLFKVAVSQPKVPPGVDPKSILCEFFKAGQCTKGFKCKFSHDLNVHRKGEKIDIYSDKRDDEDTMEEWDQEMLEKVVESKKNDYNPNKATEIQKDSRMVWDYPNGQTTHFRYISPYMCGGREDNLFIGNIDDVSVDGATPLTSQSSDGKKLFLMICTLRLWHGVGTTTTSSS